jgi:hypothetical protein
MRWASLGRPREAKPRLRRDRMGTPLHTSPPGPVAERPHRHHAMAFQIPHLRRDWAYPLPHLRRDWATSRHTPKSTLEYPVKCPPRTPLSIPLRTGFPLKGAACRLGSSILKTASSKKSRRVPPEYPLSTLVRSYAHEHGFDVITTTNATSRWKDATQVFTRYSRGTHTRYSPVLAGTHGVLAHEPMARPDAGALQPYSKVLTRY